MTHDFPYLAPLGEAALTVTLGDRVASETHRRVLQVAATLRQGLGGRALEIVPAFSSVTVFFDPLHFSADEMTAAITALLPDAAADTASSPAGRHWDIPVRYDGPDLSAVAAATGLTDAEVVARHSAMLYTVHCLGFAPGFAYLGPLDDTLVLPRQSTPRRRIEPGTVAIAGRQTAVYPLPTAGGWHLLGRTDLRLFDPARTPAALLAPSDTVRFIAT